MEKGWLKNSVVDLARNIFDKVDFGLFEMNYSQPLKIGESNSQPIILEEDSKGVSDNQESQFFIHSLNSNINNIDKEKKKNYEILKYTKPILKVKIWLDLYKQLINLFRSLKLLKKWIKNN